jgi:cytochrome P450
MAVPHPITTTPMPDARARELAAGFDLRHLGAEFYANPYPVYAALREQQPVRQLPDGSWFLTRHADLVAVYKDASTFSSDKKVEFNAKYHRSSLAAGSPPAPLYEHHTSSLVFNDPPLHTRVRKLIMGALSRRAIADMESGLVTLVDGLLNQLGQQGGGDLVEDFAAAIPIEVIGNLLGVPVADRGPLRGWSLAILGALEPALTPEQERLGNAAVTEFKSYLKQLVAERRRNPGDPQRDVLTRLIQGESPDPAGQLNEVELLQNCVFILNAGHETTTNLIANALVALQEWPEEAAYLLQNKELLVGDAPWQSDEMALAVDEFLRFESSNQLGNRRSLRDAVVGGVHLPAGSLITLCIGAANRDPEAFERAETLNLRRTDNRHLAFGFGIHQCAGMSLARLEGSIALSKFLQRFPNYRLTAPPTRAHRVRFRGFLRAPFTL